MGDLRLRIFFSFVPLLLIQCVWSQSPRPASYVKVTSKDGNFIVTGLVSNDRTRVELLSIVRNELSVSSASEDIKIDPGATSFSFSWKNDVAKGLRAFRQRQNGIYYYTRDTEADRRAAESFISRTKIVDVRTGASVSLVDSRNVVTLINLFATWLGPSKKDLPVLNDLYENYRGQGLDVVAVNVDEEPEMQSSAFAEKLGLRLRVVTGSSEFVDQITNVSNFAGIPQTVVFRGGKIERIYVGASPSSLAEVREYIRSVFSAK